MRVSSGAFSTKKSLSEDEVSSVSLSASTITDIGTMVFGVGVEGAAIFDVVVINLWGFQVAGRVCSGDSTFYLCNLGSLVGIAVVEEGGWLILVSCYIFTVVLSSYRHSDLWSCLSG